MLRFGEIADETREAPVLLMHHLLGRLSGNPVASLGRLNRSARIVRIVSPLKAKRKPFDVLAEGLEGTNGRGDRAAFGG